MCGIFGITNKNQASYYTYLGLHALQHRGEEASGIAATDGARFTRQIAKGLVDEGLNSAKINALKGDSAIGHVRYSTAGSAFQRNAQPIARNIRPWGTIAIVHNGNIPGYLGMRQVFKKNGYVFSTDSDTELFLAAIEEESKKSNVSSFEGVLKNAISPIQGAYSLLILTREYFAAIRDPWGVRPLSLGRLGQSFCVSSETTAFDLIGARFEREIKPGEILTVERNARSQIRCSKIESPINEQGQTARCVFELVYFSRPDSYLFSKHVYSARKEMGRRLAEEAPAPGAQVVIPVPDSANAQALGYAQKLGLPCEEGLIRSHYIGRTFIAPKQDLREAGVKLKYNPVQCILKGKNVVVVDDSIVRGTTSKKIIKLIREIGLAKSVHLRVASPPIISPCFYGIDMPTRKELIASHRDIEAIRRFLNVDSLKYLSLEGMLEVAGADTRSFCHACFSGKYRIAKEAVERSLSV